MSELNQCPCNPACKCKMDEPCLGCEAYSAWNSRPSDKLEVSPWVSVEDRLPEEDLYKRVLIRSSSEIKIASFWEHKQIGLVFNARGGFYNSKGMAVGAYKDYGAKPITHWMPIPL